MPNTYFIADWHYGHENIISYDNRPFKTVDDMNAELIKRWNDKVRKGDLVYVLGDMFWCKSSEAVPILRQLNGEKFLVKGNHDRSNDGAFRREFAKINEYMEVEVDDRRLVLCHYPIPFFKNHTRDGWSHLYGHVHVSFEYNMTEHIRHEIVDLYQKPCRMYNVGAMMPWMDYTPRTFDEIVEGYERYQEMVKRQ